MPTPLTLFHGNLQSQHYTALTPHLSPRGLGQLLCPVHHPTKCSTSPDLARAFIVAWCPPLEEGTQSPVLTLLSCVVICTYV